MFNTGKFKAKLFFLLQFPDLGVSQVKSVLLAKIFLCGTDLQLVQHTFELNKNWIRKVKLEKPQEEQQTKGPASKMDGSSNLIYSVNNNK